MLIHIVTAAPAQAPEITGGHLLGTVGAGGLALSLTAVLYLGIREPKTKAGGGTKTLLRRRLESDEATGVALVAGTLYSAAGSIWTTSDDVSLSLATVFTDGAFGEAGLGAVSLVCLAVTGMRKLSPGRAAIFGLFTAAIWGAAGGIWGIPEYLILRIAEALGLIA